MKSIILLIILFTILFIACIYTAIHTPYCEQPVRFMTMDKLKYCLTL